MKSPRTKDLALPKLEFPIYQCKHKHGWMHRAERYFLANGVCQPEVNNFEFLESLRKTVGNIAPEWEPSSLELIKGDHEVSEVQPGPRLGKHEENQPPGQGEPMLRTKRSTLFIVDPGKIGDQYSLDEGLNALRHERQGYSKWGQGNTRRELVTLPQGVHCMVITDSGMPNNFTYGLIFLKCMCKTFWHDGARMERYVLVLTRGDPTTEVRKRNLTRASIGPLSSLWARPSKALRLQWFPGYKPRFTLEDGQPNSSHPTTKLMEARKDLEDKVQLKGGGSVMTPDLEDKVHLKGDGTVMTSHVEDSFPSEGTESIQEYFARAFLAWETFGAEVSEDHRGVVETPVETSKYRARPRALETLGAEVSEDHLGVETEFPIRPEIRASPSQGRAPKPSPRISESAASEKKAKADEPREDIELSAWTSQVHELCGINARKTNEEQDISARSNEPRGEGGFKWEHEPRALMAQFEFKWRSRSFLDLAGLLSPI